MKKQVISENQIAEVVARFERGEFVSIIFTKADGTRRTALAQFGVANPVNAPAPKGTGESAKEALTRGRLKFFDASVENPDGSRGNYRQALFSRILTITGNGITYIVDHASTATAQA